MTASSILDSINCWLKFCRFSWIFWGSFVDIGIQVKTSLVFGKMDLVVDINFRAWLRIFFGFCSRLLRPMWNSMVLGSDFLAYLVTIVWMWLMLAPGYEWISVSSVAIVILFRFDDPMMTVDFLNSGSDHDDLLVVL